MQVVLDIHLNEMCTLPLSYHHIVQSALYGLMTEDNEEDSRYHEEGSQYNSRVYRAFTFGLLKGRYHIEGKQIVFEDVMTLEIRSLDKYCIGLITDNIMKKGIRLGKNKLTDIKIMQNDYKVLDDDIIIFMKSPICVYKTDTETKHTHFYTPWDEGFYTAVEENFIRKYSALSGKTPDNEISFESVKVKEKDKYVTNYKGFIMSGWKGIYRLNGKPEYLDFLYQTGLGAKNAQGFGMFDVVR